MNERKEFGGQRQKWKSPSEPKNLQVEDKRHLIIITVP